MNGSVVFARLCQCAPHLMYASLCPSESTTQTASPSFQPFLHSLQQSVVGHAQPARECHVLSLKIAPLHRVILDPHLIRDFLDPPESSTQTASRLVQPFLHSWPQNVPILYSRLGRPFPLKIAASCGGSGPPSNAWFLGPTRVLTQMASRSVQPFCKAQYGDRQTDRSTDIPRTTLLGQ